MYAPSIGADRAAFFTDLAVQLTTDRHLLVGGDWNCVLQPADEQQPCHSRQVGAAALAALMAQFNLVDAWPGHGRGRGYTHPATAKPCSAARLDRWLVSAAVLPWLRGIDRILGAPGDHHGVRLRVAIPGLPPLGQSGWAFPTYILYHPSLLPTLKAAVDTRAGELNALADPRVAWELLKAFVRTKADAIHRAHLRQAAAQVRAARATAEQAVTRAEQPHATGTERAEAVLATAVLAEVVQAAEGKEQRARAALYQCQGERGTRWFHSLAKELRPPTVITHLRVPGGGDAVPLDGPGHLDTITRAATATYSSDSPSGLFRPGVTDPAAQQQLLGHVAPMSVEQRDAAEGPDPQGICLVELFAALQGSANGKAAGSDGLPYEVYKVLWGGLGPALLKAVQAVFQAGAGVSDGAAAAAALPASWLEGIISLIYKGKDLPRDVLLNYRPITLLNCDLKLVSKAVNNRLQPALASLIDVMQTAFLAGRDAADNVLYHQALTEWLHASQQPAALLLLDIEKAYDRVDRDWLLAVVAAMGFGPMIQRWVRLLTADSMSSVVVNGHRSLPFPVRTGLPQGSTLSPVLWVIQLQPFTAYLRHLASSRALRMPALPDGSPAPPAAHHADDTTLLVSDLAQDGPVVMAAIHLFCQASNARVNASKSRGLLLGPHPPVVGTCPHTGVKFPAPGKDPPVHLGIPLTRDPAVATRLVYPRRLALVRSRAARWRAALALSRVGRVHVAKQELANTVAYHFRFVAPSPAMLTALQLEVDRWVAWSLLPEDASLVAHGHAVMLPKRPVACLEWAEGGMGHPDLASFLAALQAKTVAQLGLPGNEPWKALTRGLLALGPPVGTVTWTWPYYTAPLEACPASLPSRLRTMVELYRQTQPARISPPPGAVPAALLCEPLFYNPSLADPATGQPFLPPQPLPDGFPLTLRSLGGAPPALRAVHPLPAILAALPPSWLQMVDPAAPAGPATQGPWRLSPCRQWVHGPQGIQPVLPSGRLTTLPEGAQPPLPLATWQAACVMAARKPRARWTVVEYLAYQQTPLHDRPQAAPREHHLLGTWPEVRLDPWIPRCWSRTWRRTGP